MSATDPKEKTERVSQRSPSYPSFSLDEAIAKSRVLWDKDKKSPMPEKALLAHLGYSVMSGPAARTLSTLKRYNLIRKDGERIILTDNAVNIILHDESDSEYREAICVTALAPSIYNELYTQYNGNLPSDKTLRIELIQSKKFNANKVDRFIQDFKRTIEFAKLSGPIRTESTLEEGEGSGKTESDLSLQKPRLPKRIEGMRELRYTLASGDAVLYFPNQMQDKDFELLKGYLDLAKQAEQARARERANEPPANPQK